jgi:hypothetical protein
MMNLCLTSMYVDPCTVRYGESRTITPTRTGASYLHSKLLRKLSCNRPVAYRLRTVPGTLGSFKLLFVFVDCLRCTRLGSFFLMPPDDNNDGNGTGDNPPSSTNLSSFKQQASRVRNLFSIPAPVKRLFDRVPVLTYPPNELPQRTPRPTKLPSLYVFIRDEDAAAGRPSFNPGCLKWQVGDAEISLSGGLLTFLRFF